MLKKKLTLDKELVTNNDERFEGGGPTSGCSDICTMFCQTMATFCGGTCGCQSGAISCGDDTE